MAYRRLLLWAAVILLAASLIMAFAVAIPQAGGLDGYVLYIDNSAYEDYYPEEILRGFMIEYKSLGMEYVMPIRFVDAANTDMDTIVSLARGATYIVGPHDSTTLSQVLRELKKQNIWRRVISAASTAYSLRGTYPGLLRVMPNDDTFMRDLAAFASAYCSVVKYLESNTNPVYSASLKERFNHYFKSANNGSNICVLSTEYNILRVMEQAKQGYIYLLPPEAYSKLIEVSQITVVVSIPFDPGVIMETLPYTLGAETAYVVKSLAQNDFHFDGKGMIVRAPDGHLIVFDEAGDRVPPVAGTVWMWKDGKWLEVPKR